MDNVKFANSTVTYDGKSHSIIATGLPKGVKVTYTGNGKVETGTYTVVIEIENGNGIMSVPVELDGTFKTLLVKYYETNDMTEIKKWVYDNCLDGV